MTLEFNGERIIEGKTPSWIVRHHLARYTFAAKYCRDKKVLDVGCGTGYGALVLRTEGGAKQVVGTDISEEAIAYAATRYKAEGIEFHVADVLQLPTLGGGRFRGYFDVVVAFELIEHVLKPRAAVLAMREVLSPTGVLIISTPNRVFNSPWIHSWEEPLNTFHIREFSRREFRSLVKSSFSVAPLYGQYLFPGRYWGALVADYIHATLENRFSRADGCGIRPMRFYEEAHTLILIGRPTSSYGFIRRLRRKVRALLFDLALKASKRQVR